MKTYFKHLLCLSTGAVLLLTVQACRKTNSNALTKQQEDSIYLANRYDFRDQIVGYYTGQIHRTQTSPPPDMFDTIQGAGTFHVYKVLSDTVSIMIDSKMLSHLAYVGSDTVDYFALSSSDPYAVFYLQNGQWQMHFVFDDNARYWSYHQYSYTDATKLP